MLAHRLLKMMHKQVPAITIIDPYFASVDYLVMVENGQIVEKKGKTLVNNGCSVVGNEINLQNGYLTLTNLSRSDNASLPFTLEFFGRSSDLLNNYTFSGWWGVAANPFPSFSTFNGNGYGQDGPEADGALISTDSNNHHYCFMRTADGYHYLFQDGVRCAYNQNSGGASINTGIAWIGRSYYADNTSFSKFITQLRFTLGAARYPIGGFTPPVAFPATSNIAPAIATLDFENGVVDKVDNSQYTLVGNPANVYTATSPNGTTALYVNSGGGDYYQSPKAYSIPNKFQLSFDVYVNWYNDGGYGQPVLEFSDNGGNGRIFQIEIFNGFPIIRQYDSPTVWTGTDWWNPPFKLQNNTSYHVVLTVDGPNATYTINGISIPIGSNWSPRSDVVLKIGGVPAQDWNNWKSFYLDNLQLISLT